MDVRVYTTPTCGYCRQAKLFLAERGVRYTEHDVSRDRAAAEEMVRLAGQMGVPVIVIDGQVIIGFDRPRLESLLAGSNGRPRLGLKVADASRMTRSGVNGAYVGGVNTSSPGERAGLRVGDIIVEVNARRLNGADDLESVLSGLTAGSRVRIVFLRDGQTLQTEIIT